MMQINVKRCVYYWTTGSESFILIGSNFQCLGRKSYGGPFVPVDVHGLMAAVNKILL